MVIVLKYNVLYVENKDMLQETNVVHYETYIDTDHQMATEKKVKMYINNNLQLAEVDLHQGLLLQPEAEVDATENQDVVERKGDLRVQSMLSKKIVNRHRRVMKTCLSYRIAKKKMSDVLTRHLRQVLRLWRLKSRSATSKRTCRRTAMTCHV